MNDEEALEEIMKTMETMMRGSGQIGMINVG